MSPQNSLAFIYDQKNPPACENANGASLKITRLLAALVFRKRVHRRRVDLHFIQLPTCVLRKKDAFLLQFLPFGRQRFVCLLAPESGQLPIRPHHAMSGHPGVGVVAHSLAHGTRVLGLVQRAGDFPIRRNITGRDLCDLRENVLSKGGGRHDWTRNDCCDCCVKERLE